jgi:hypothetical protein
VGVAGLGSQLFQHATSRLKRHDAAPAQCKGNGHAASARANIQNGNARPKPGGPPELVEVLMGQGGAVPTIVNARIRREVDALGHGFVL